MRIGIYGGSFDPIHIGHLLLAETVRERLKLDEVRFVPAAQSPLKLDIKPTADKQRLEMLELAIGGHEHFRIDPREIQRGGVSYTVDTLRELTTEQTEDDLFFIMGADSLADLPRWRDPSEICRLAFPVVVARGGEPAPDWSILEEYMPADRIEFVKESSISIPLIELSSSEIRKRVKENRSIRYRVPRAVEAYIQSHHLYT